MVVEFSLSNKLECFEDDGGFLDCFVGDGDVTSISSSIKSSLFLSPGSSLCS